MSAIHRAVTLPFTFPPKLLDERALAAAVAGLPRFNTVRYRVSVDSTNAWALAVLVDYDDDCISFVTESQEMGRGRAGRSWLSPPCAGLLCSTILPGKIHNAALPAVGYWVALAASDAIHQVCGVAVAMKWPNDLLLDGKKCAGILCEGRAFGQASRVVAGIGINVNRPEGVLNELACSAAWLSDAAGTGVDRTALAAALLSQYERRFDDLLVPAAVIGAWERRSGIAGRRLRVRDARGAVLCEGSALGIAPDGALLIEEAGEERRVTLGDVDVM